MASLTRINTRVDEEKKNVITKPAELDGHRIQLSARDWKTLTDHLDAPPKNLPALKALLNRERRFQDW